MSGSTGESEEGRLTINAADDQTHQNRQWHAIEMRVSPTCHTTSRRHLVRGEDIDEACEILNKAYEMGVIWRQGWTEAGPTKGTDTVEESSFESAMEWLVSGSSPNSAVWPDTDPKHQDEIKILGRTTARSLQGWFDE